MPMSASADNPPRPPIYVLSSEFDALSELASRGHGLGANLLAQELERAEIVADRTRRAFVRLGSDVEYTDMQSGRTWQVRLVTPNLADADNNWISVLSPAGAALLGLKVGDRFYWQEPTGRRRELVIRRLAGGAPLTREASPSAGRV